MGNPNVCDIRESVRSLHVGQIFRGWPLWGRITAQIGDIVNEQEKYALSNCFNRGLPMAAGLQYAEMEPEYHFEFVEGRWPHLEGNWSVHTTDFSKSKLYGYYNGLDISDILATENELREIIAEHGPFDGILGYSEPQSQGGTLAAQLVIRYIAENPFATIQELPLKFAIFINGATPPCVLPLGGEEAYDCALAEFEEAAHLFKVFKPNDSDNVTRLRPAKLSNGRKVCKYPSKPLW
ncbi:hypothetical protein PG994_001390 [Apiospora phragmitis]|uniref:Serine hydrolase domain-containing protein n=1 Tax=Apiospora phragmitis TaxID=2905665 RepID=A0ABR1WTD3_9PEZI